MPIPRGLAGPGLLADTIIRRWDDHCPLNRLERIYEREGARLNRSTLCGWHDELSRLATPLLHAMHEDALRSPYLCTDATGVLVQAPEKCSRGHFWVLVAPGRHVLFMFSHEHDSRAVDKLLAGYKGIVLADAHSVFDHLFVRDDESVAAVECGCWAHARRYFVKLIATEPQLAREVLANLGALFRLERKFTDQPRAKRARMRKTKAKVLVDRHFQWCQNHKTEALDETPLKAAITYSTNQEQALRRFLLDARLPLTNNIPERELRRQAVGRANWKFVGSTDGANANCTFTSLIASCHMLGIEPAAYLRDLLCLLPEWPRTRVLDLAPVHWKQTREQTETQKLLAANVYRDAILKLDAHPEQT